MSTPSRGPARPAPEVARSVTVMLFLGLALLHFTQLPTAFELEAYVGVSESVATGVVLFGAFWMMTEDRDRVWWFALAEGLFNGGGWLFSRTVGLPVTEHELAGDWVAAPGLALFFLGAVLAGMSIWILWVRRYARLNERAEILDRAASRKPPPR